MKTKKQILTVLIIALLFLISCSKYDDNPAISLKTKKSRLCREWTLTKLDTFNIDSLGGSSYKLKFTKDNKAYYKSEVYYTSFDTARSIGAGDWKFSSDKKSIILGLYQQLVDTITYQSLNDSVYYVSTLPIKKLTSKELIYTYTASDNSNQTFYYKSK